MRAEPKKSYKNACELCDDRSLNQYTQTCPMEPLPLGLLRGRDTLLQKLRVSNYRSIGDISLDLSEQTIFVGPNGAGKSNLIDSLNFVKDSVQDDLDSAVTRRHGAEAVRRWSKYRPFNVNFEFSFEAPEGRGSYGFTLGSSGGAFHVHEEKGHWENLRRSISRDSTTSGFIRNADGRAKFYGSAVDESDNRTIKMGSTDLVLTQAATGLFHPLFRSFRGLADQVTEMSTYSIYPNTIRTPQQIAKEDYLLNDGSNLAAILKRLNTNQRRLKERLLDAMRVVMPSLSDILIKSAGGYYIPVFRVREANGEVHEFNMAQLSDGTLRMLGLLTAFYQVKAPRRIALEEPEQMIHPGLLPLLQEAAGDYVNIRPDRQFFITTHSPTFLNQFEPEDIVWVKFDNGITKANRIKASKLQLIKEDLFSPGEILISEGLGL